MPQNLELTNLNPAPVALQAAPTTLTLPNGKRIHDLLLLLKSGAGQRIADGFGDIVLFIGGNPNITLSAEELDSLNQLYDANHGAINDDPGLEGALPLLFSQWYRKTVPAAEAFALDIPLGLPVTLDINTKAAVVAPTIKVRGTVDSLDRIPENERNLSGGLPTLCKVFRRNLATGSDVVYAEDILKKERYQLMRFFNPTGTTIDKVEIIKDGEIIHQLTKVENDALLTRHGMNPQDDVYDFVPDFSDKVSDWLNLNGSRELKVKFTLAASTTNPIKMITVRWGTPE